MKVHAFTKTPDEENPAGVVLKPGQLTAQQMKLISQRLHVSETTFVFPSSNADFHARFFSPAVEVDLCGHATIAAFTVLAENFQPANSDPILITQETKVGILPVKLYFKCDRTIDYVLMKQGRPIFEPVSYDSEIIARVLDIGVESICTDFPQERVSTGLFTLPVCMSSFSALERIKPNFRQVKQFCERINVGSIHVFTFDTSESDSVYHARNFAPLYGINEDPVTGTANGAVCSYLRHHHYISKKELVCEQGDIIGKKGRVHVLFEDDEVWVGGYAVIKEIIELHV